MFNPTSASIDLDLLRDNLCKIKTFATNSKVLAMVKGDAYGHGAVEVSRKIEAEVDALGVAFLKEALKLSEARLRKPIVIFTGFADLEELDTIDRFGFETVIHNFAQLEILEQSNLVHELPVWLKIDTGMHRLGFAPAQVAEAYARLMAHPRVRKPLRLMTHFSDADDDTSDLTPQQIKIFRETVAGLDGEWCLANSAAILDWPETRTAWIRPGLAIYGVSPMADRLGTHWGLKPVMTLASKIIAIREVAVGERVGYGGAFIATQPLLVGTVAIGYGDGYPRDTKNCPVLVDSVRTRLIGRAAMDMVGVDLTNLPEARVGSEVILWGDGLPIEEVARHLDTIPYELFCRLTSRVKYQFCHHHWDVYSS